MKVSRYLRSRVLAPVALAVALLATPSAAQPFDRESWLAATLQALFTGAPVDPDEVTRVLQENFPPTVQNWLGGLLAVIAETPGAAPTFLLSRDTETGDLVWTGTTLALAPGNTALPDNTDLLQDEARRSAQDTVDAVPQTVRCEGEACGFTAERTRSWSLLPPSLDVDMARDDAPAAHRLDEFDFDEDEIDVLRVLLALDEMMMLSTTTDSVEQEFVTIGFGRFRRDVLVGEEEHVLFFAGGNLLTAPERMDQLGTLGVQAFYTADLTGITEAGRSVEGNLHLSGRFGVGGSTLDALMTVSVPDQPLSGFLGPYVDTLAGTVAVTGNGFADNGRLATMNADSLRFSGATAGLDGAFFGADAQAIAGAFDYQRPAAFLRTELSAVGVFQGTAVAVDPIAR